MSIEWDPRFDLAPLGFDVAPHYREIVCILAERRGWSLSKTFEFLIDLGLTQLKDRDEVTTAAIARVMNAEADAPPTGRWRDMGKTN